MDCMVKLWLLIDILFVQCCPSAVSPSAPGAGFVNVAGGSQGQVGDVNI